MRFKGVSSWCFFFFGLIFLSISTYDFCFAFGHWWHCCMMLTSFRGSSSTWRSDILLVFFFLSCEDMYSLMKVPLPSRWIGVDLFLKEKHEISALWRTLEWITVWKEISEQTLEFESWRSFLSLLLKKFTTQIKFHLHLRCKQLKQERLRGDNMSAAIPFTFTIDITLYLL